MNGNWLMARFPTPCPAVRERWRAWPPGRFPAAASLRAESTMALETQHGRNFLSLRQRLGIQFECLASVADGFHGGGVQQIVTTLPNPRFERLFVPNTAPFGIP